jgi:hypothetical protein
MSGGCLPAWPPCKKVTANEDFLFVFPLSNCLAGSVRTSWTCGSPKVPHSVNISHFEAALSGYGCQACRACRSGCMLPSIFTAATSYLVDIYLLLLCSLSSPACLPACLLACLPPPSQKAAVQTEREQLVVSHLRSLFQAAFDDV